MKTVSLSEKVDTHSPAGAEVRFMVEGATGGMIHCTLPPFQVNKAVIHATVNEFWYVLSGHGEIWRDNGIDSSVTKLSAGMSINILPDTVFQYRSVSDEALTFICITMPPWPSDTEASFVDKGKWVPTV
ncbi:cupin domain-containing protein [uncultured Shewanella sp.]|uniref:cupin domain-containing protein n=1 Tax=uncultured Shewanella sp. TaxID=173975 RepID=UPI002614A1C8|nr:cupin domain-containing protein [uncultured Shewanella sp.]